MAFLACSTHTFVSLLDLAAMSWTDPESTFELLLLGGLSSRMWFLCQEILPPTKQPMVLRGAGIIR